MHQLHVILGLQHVELAHQGHETGLGGQLGGVLPGVMQHALLATGHRQQFAVERDVPVPWQAGIPECRVEGDAMAVALGIGQRAVDVEDECLQHGASIARLDP